MTDRILDKTDVLRTEAVDRLRYFFSIQSRRVDEGLAFKFVIRAVDKEPEPVARNSDAAESAVSQDYSIVRFNIGLQCDHERMRVDDPG